MEASEFGEEDILQLIKADWLFVNDSSVKLIQCDQEVDAAKENIDYWYDTENK